MSGLGAPLLQAAKDGNVGSVRLLLINTRAEHVNYCDVETKCTALIWASEKGRTEIVKILLADGRVDVNMQNKDGYSALMLASQEGHIEIVKMLLADKRVDVNMQDKYDSHTALTWASSNRRTEIVKMLLADNRVNVNVQFKYGETALLMASEEGHTEIVQILLADSRVDVNRQQTIGGTALMVASKEGYSEVVKVLLADNRVDVNVEGRHGYTALMMAAQGGCTEVVKILLADGRVDVNLEVENGPSPLYAVKNEDIKALLMSYVPPPPLSVPAPPLPTVVLVNPLLLAEPPRSVPAPTTAAKSERGWLAARLRKDGMDEERCQECEQALVVREGFYTERDFAEAEDVDAAYLSSIGITGKGIQNRLLKLHRELSAQHAHTSVDTVGGTKKSDVIISDPSSVAALTAQVATLTAQLTALAAQVADLQLQGQQDRQLLVADSSREG